MSRLRSMIRESLANEDGATMVEYALLLGLIAVVLIGVVSVVGTNAKHLFGPVAGTL